MNGAQHAVVASRLKVNTVVLTKTRFALHNRASRFSTPTALCPPAQGCKARATLGVRVVGFFQLQRGCGMVPRRADGRNPVGVVCVWRALPKVAPRTAQPLGWRTESRWDSTGRPGVEGMREMIANLQPYPEYKESGSRWLLDELLKGGAK